MWGSVKWRITRLALSRNNQIKRAAVQKRSNRNISFFVLQLHLDSRSGLPHYIVIKYESEWHPPVFEFPPFLGPPERHKGREMQSTIGFAFKAGGQEVQIFSR